MKKPVITYDPHGETGNIFWILGQLRKEMQKQRRIDAYNQIWERVQKSGSYEEALKIISEEADLVPERNTTDHTTKL